jgi:hypothetical protein
VALGSPRIISRRVRATVRGVRSSLGSVDREVSLDLERGFETVQEPVDRVAQVSQLVARSFQGEPLVKTVLGDLAGRLGDGFRGRSTRPATSHPSAIEATTMTSAGGDSASHRVPQQRSNSNLSWLTGRRHPTIRGLLD